MAIPIPDRDVLAEMTPAQRDRAHDLISRVIRSKIKRTIPPARRRRAVEVAGAYLAPGDRALLKRAVSKPDPFEKHVIGALGIDPRPAITVGCVDRLLGALTLAANVR